MDSQKEQIFLSDFTAFRVHVLLAVILIHLAMVDWRLGLMPLAAIATHELGYIGYLTQQRTKWSIKRKGLQLQSHLESIALTSLQSILLYLSGTIFNLALAALALLAHVITEPSQDYLLQFANMNALVGVVNLLPVGRATSFGQFLKQMLPIGKDKMTAVLRMEILFSVFVMIWASQGYDTDVSINIALALLWANIHALFANKDFERHLTVGKLDSREIFRMGLIPIILLLFGLVVLHSTPFFLSGESLTQLTSALKNTFPQIRWLFEFLALGAAVLVFSTMWHELGHWMIAKRYDYPINRVVIGHPGHPSKPYRMLGSFTLFGTRIEVYKRLYLAAVDIDIKDNPILFTDTFWRTFVFSHSGVFMNMLLVILGIGIQGVFPTLATNLIVINGILIAVNLIPLPGLDGGWLLIRFAIWLRTMISRATKKLSPEEERKLAYDTFDILYGKVGTKVPHLLTAGSLLYLYLSLML